MSDYSQKIIEHFNKNGKVPLRSFIANEMLGLDSDSADIFNRTTGKSFSQQIWIENCRVYDTHQIRPNSRGYSCRTLFFDEDMGSRFLDDYWPPTEIYQYLVERFEDSYRYALFIPGTGIVFGVDHILKEFKQNKESPGELSRLLMSFISEQLVENALEKLESAGYQHKGENVDLYGKLRSMFDRCKFQKDVRAIANVIEAIPDDLFFERYFDFCLGLTRILSDKCRMVSLPNSFVKSSFLSLKLNLSGDLTSVEDLAGMRYPEYFRHKVWIQTTNNYIEPENTPVNEAVKTYNPYSKLIVEVRAFWRERCSKNLGLGLVPPQTLKNESIDIFDSEGYLTKEFKEYLSE